MHGKWFFFIFLGKLSQHPEKQTTICVKSQEKVNECFASKSTRIVEVSLPTEEVMQLSYVPHKDFVRMDPQTNVVLGAYVTGRVYTEYFITF